MTVGETVQVVVRHLPSNYGVFWYLSIKLSMLIFITERAELPARHVAEDPSIPTLLLPGSCGPTTSRLPAYEPSLKSYNGEGASSVTEKENKQSDLPRVRC